LNYLAGNVKFFSFARTGFNHEKKRSYEVISEAFQGWDAGDAANASQLFRRGIAAGPDGVDSAGKAVNDQTCGCNGASINVWIACTGLHLH
jgi:hypothetical protein